MIPDSHGDDHDHDLECEEAANEHPSGIEHRLDETGCSSTSRLENLPAELRTLLLSSLPDLPTLRSLVRASPVVHTQYRHSRNTILRAVLHREMSGFLPDAYAAVKSRARELGSPRTDENITDFLDTYEAWLSDSTPPPTIDYVSPGRIRWLAAFHISVAQPLARLYSNWAISNLRQAVSSSTDQQENPEEFKTEGSPTSAQHDQEVSLSRSEEKRVFRALYRYETFQHLFGQNQARRQGAFRHHEINDLFLSLFDPWEAEAIGCMDIFVRSQYGEIFDQIKKDLHPKNTKFRQKNGVYNPDGSFDLESEHDDYMNGTVARGLKMLIRLLQIDDHETLVAKMARCLTHHREQDAPMRRVLGSLAQCDRRELSTKFPNIRDEAEQRRVTMNFLGDAGPPAGPPIAWVLLWNGKYANIYGDYVPQPLRQWGYVMWDERRWINMRAGDLVAKQWKLSPHLIEEIENDCDWRPEGC